MAGNVGIKVLIADDDKQFARRMADYLKDQGFFVRTAHRGSDAKDLILDWKPRFVLADLMLIECNALELIKFVNSHKELKKVGTGVLVISGHNSTANVKSAFQQGALDYLVKPFDLESVTSRLLFHTRKVKVVKDLTPQEMDSIGTGKMMLYLTDLLLRQALKPVPLEERLFNLTRMVATKLGAIRCNIIHCLNQRQGVVISSNDDFDASGIQLDLERYPEVLYVLNTDKVLAIEDLSESVQFRRIRKFLEHIQFNSMIVCPVRWDNEVRAVLSLRMPESKKALSDNEVRFCEIVAHIVSLSISAENNLENKVFWKRAG